MAQNRPKPGDMVVLTEVRPELLNDLPMEDQQGIYEVIGKPVRLSKYDAEGRAELEFTDRAGGIHFVYVSPNVITAAK
jgi:hypothetical protein